MSGSTAAAVAPPAARIPTPALRSRAHRFQPGDRIWPGLSACTLLGNDDRTERWLAWSQPLWSRVVVKLPREEHMDDLRTVRRLAGEARLLRRLSHPGVPRLLEDRHDHPVPHLILEHVEGGTLDQLLRAAGPLLAADVVRLGLRLASCLRRVHARGLVHLGIEPGAIALRDGQPVLLDLGGARRAGGSPPPVRTRAGAYQAPERCLRARADPRMDLFSLGAVLYQLATGRSPLPSEDGRPGCQHPQLVAVPARAQALRPGLPPELDAALHALLERDVSRRPQTAVGALRLLASALPPGEACAWPAFADRLLDAG